MATQLRISTTALAAIALLVALAALGPGAARGEAAQCKGGDKPAYSLKAKQARKATLCLLNKERHSRGLKHLRFDRDQQQAASRHSRMMVKDRCFSHQCSGERDLVGRFEDSGYLPCNCYWSVAENIAYGTGGTSSPRSVVGAWMDSPPHRVNILNKQFEAVGVGISRGSPDGDSGAATFTLDFGFKD
jgi:uncharacterized protein YkwD